MPFALLTKSNNKDWLLLVHCMCQPVPRNYLLILIGNNNGIWTFFIGTLKFWNGQPFLSYEDGKW